jgi:TraX protein
VDPTPAIGALPLEPRGGTAQRRRRAMTTSALPPSRAKDGPALALRAPAVPHALPIENSTLEALKWFALVLMVLDHVNKYLFAASWSVVPELSRCVAPIFATVLGLNLSRPWALHKGAHARTAARLLVFGLLATPASAALHGAWPLNILFTLLAGTLVVLALQHNTAAHLAAGGIVCIAAGFATDYGVVGVATVVTAFACGQHASLARVLAWVACIAGYVFVNDNVWALLAAPLMLAAPFVHGLKVPQRQQLRWFFYAVYPLHLTVIWGLASWRG